MKLLPELQAAFKNLEDKLWDWIDTHQKTNRDLFQKVEDLKTEKTKLEEQLEIYRASRFLEIKCKDPEQTRDFLKQHYVRCKELNSHNLGAYFLSIIFTSENVAQGTLDLSDRDYFPAFLYLSVRGPVSDNFKLICRVCDVDHVGIGFRKIEDSKKWIAFSSATPTLYLNHQQKYQQDNFQDSNGYLSEIKFLGQK